MLQCEAINGPRPYFEVSMNDVARMEVFGDFEQLVHNVLLVDRLQDARLGGRVEVCVCVEASKSVCVCVCARACACTCIQVRMRVCGVQACVACVCMRTHVQVRVVCRFVWSMCMCGWDVGEWGNERQCKQVEWNIPAVPKLLKA